MVYQGRYTYRFFSECAKLAKKRNENFLLRKVGDFIKDLGKSQEVGSGSPEIK